MKSYAKIMSASFLDSEELADIAEYYHIIGKDEEAKAAARYAINIFPEQ